MDGIISNRRLMMIFGMPAILAAAAACDGDSVSGVRRSSGVTELQNESTEDLAEYVLPDWYEGERPVLRARIDVARERVWVLTWSGVELYDAKARQKLARVLLPDWSRARKLNTCPPDLVVGAKGEALISSNAVPTLWRIDPTTFSVNKHEPVPDKEDERKEIGFSALAYSPQQGVYFAMSTSHGLLWRIDPLFRRAQNIPLSAPIRGGCGLDVITRAPGGRASRFLGLCVRSDRKEWTINLAPDQRSGYVLEARCKVDSR
jgi:hypothetical protein